MTECARRLEANVSIGKQEFLANQQAQDASCYLMIRIAEAIRDLPDEVKLAHDEINWVAVTGMRNRLAHQYVGINLEFVWVAATRDVPPLLRTLGWKD